MCSVGGKIVTIDEFQVEIEKIYKELPLKIRQEIQIEIQEDKPEDNIENMFGFYIPLTKSVVLCYWAFKEYGDFSIPHIKRIIDHEITHHLDGGMLGKLHAEEEKNYYKFNPKKFEELMINEKTADISVGCYFVTYLFAFLFIAYAFTKNSLPILIITTLIFSGIVLNLDLVVKIILRVFLHLRRLR